MAIEKASLQKNVAGKKARILAFTIAKGGQLKSTSAVNIAGAIFKDESLGNKKVCIIDLDAQANVFTAFGLEADTLPENEDLSAALLGYVNQSGETVIGLAAIQNTIHELHRDGENVIDCISANEKCDLLEMTILTNLDTFKNPTTLLNDLCSVLEDYYDYIVIDTPPAYSLIVSNVFMVDCVEIYVPFEPDTYSMRSVIKTMATFDTFTEKNPSAQFGGVFATKVKTNTNIHAGIINTVRTYTQGIKKAYIKTFIPNSIKASNSVYYEALPAVLSSKRGDLVKEYIELWEEIR